MGEKQKLDPLIFEAEAAASEKRAELHSETAPGLSWGSGPSSLPPPGELASTPSSALVREGTVARANTPRGILAPGSVFGAYRVGTCIGEGGMARVYQAEHTALQRQVALKVLIDGAVGPGESSHDRFLREARLAAAIKHPNVVNIFDVGVQDGIPFLVMELLWGTDLESLITAQGALDESFLVDIMIPIVAGLAAVHDAGIVHRDLKPGNIFLATGRYEEVEPKLLDFGISKATAGEQLRLTTNGLLMGTPFYMSPEGLRGEDMTPKSDQYSLGVLMYECATGSNPFHASTFAEIFQLIGSATFASPSVARPQLSKRLERIILRAMSLHPADRFADLRELGRELLTLAGQRTKVTWALSFGDTPRTTLANALPKPEVPRPRATRVGVAKSSLLLALALLGPTVLLGLFWLSSRGGPTRSPEVASPAAGTPLSAPSSAPPTVELPSSALAPPPSSPVSEEAPRASGEAPRAELKPRRSSKAPRPEPRGPDADLRWTLPGPSPVNTPPTATHRTGSNGAPIFE